MLTNLVTEVKAVKTVSGAGKPRKTEAQIQAMLEAERRRLELYNSSKPSCTNSLMAAQLSRVVLQIPKFVPDGNGGFKKVANFVLRCQK
jgi:hypothetical protein